MLKAIDLGELVNPQKICYKTDTVLKNHNPKATKTTSKLFSTDPCEGSSKMIVPIKEYSNKFLRQSAFKQNEKDRHAAKHNRFTPIVNKHKAFQRKYQNMLSRKHYICKTEPNENEYQCFTTANNFYKTNEQPEIQRGRIKTESMIQKHLSRGDLSSYDKEEQKDVLYITPFEEECVKVKGRQEIPKKQEKISTSRALELFSKIISKDKGDLLDRMKSCNQKKLLKDRIMESSKNLEAKQIVLLEKQKKYSFVEKGENRVSLKTGLKYRKKKSNIIAHFQQNQRFQICGWDS